MEVYTLTHDENSIQCNLESGYAVEHCDTHLVSISKKKINKKKEENDNKKLILTPIDQEKTKDLLVVRRTYKYHKYCDLTLKITSFLQV